MVVKQLQRLVFAALIILFNSITFAANITLDRTTVRVNETFELTVNLTNQPGDTPDMSSLPADLEVLSNNNFYRRSIINGRTTQQSGWRFTVRAKREGIFTIPSIRIEGTQTQPVSIKVLPAVNSADINGQPDAIRLTAELDDSEVYVQEQIVYTIRLYRSVQAQYASLSEPKLDGALIEVLGDDIQYDTVIDAVPYRVLERKFAIYPQESGNFAISGVVYTAEVSSGNRRFSTLGSLRGRNRSVSLTTEPQNIIVKAIPAEYNDWWLPAKQIDLQQSWSLATDELEVGSPVTWTYTIKAQGLTGTQIPDIKPAELDGLKFYPEQAVSQNAYSDTDIVASRTQKVAVIPTRGGTVTIPEIRIPWWNVTEDKAMSLIIPEKVLTVNGDSPVTTEPVVPKINENPTITATDTNKQDPSVTLIGNNQDVLIWQIATGILAILWLSTLLWRRKRPSDSQSQPDKVSKETSEKPARTDLHKVLKKGDAAEIRKAIIEFLQSREFDVKSLSEIISLAPDSKLSVELQALDMTIYGNSSAREWSAEVIERELKSMDVTKQTSPGTSNQALPPLHPQ